MRYKNCKFRFLVDSLLFTSDITNDTSSIFITYNGLNEANVTLINAKLFEVLGVIKVKQIRNWELVKGESKWVNTVLIDSEYRSIADHFAFGLILKCAQYIKFFI